MKDGGTEVSVQREQEPLFERRGQGVFGKPAEQQAGDRDAQLKAAEEQSRIGQHALDDGGARAALFDELFNPRAADGEQGVLGRHEEGAERHQAQNCSKIEEDHSCAAVESAPHCSTREIIFLPEGTGTRCSV